MATANSLQTPKIIEVNQSYIRVAHPDIKDNTRTSLAAAIAAAGTTMTVLDNHNFADDDWMLVGEVGQTKAETTDVNGAVTRGTSMTVTNHLKFAHSIDEPITRIQERGITIYGASSDGGSGTIIESIDAKAASGTQLADAIMIQWNRDYTDILLLSTDTSYSFYYATFTDGTTESSASDYIASTGLASNTVEYFIQQALRMTNSKVGQGFERPDLIKWANDCQTAITQFSYQDPRTGQIQVKNWDFEITDDASTVTVSTNKNKYSLSSLNAKYDNNQGIIHCSLGSRDRLKKIDYESYREEVANNPYTELASAASAADTTITVDSNVQFDSSGTIYVGTDTVTYTGKSGTTIFTGVPSSGTGSVTETQAIDSGVWQGLAQAEPKKFCVFKGSIYFDKPVHSDYDSWPLNIQYFQTLTALTEESDTTVVPFTNAFQYYIASRIEERRQNLDKADRYMQKFNKIVLDAAVHHKTDATTTHEYFRYQDPLNYYL